MKQYRRWYDKDPVLKEALELLKLQDDAIQTEAAKFLLKLQEDVAQDVLSRVYEIVEKYQENGKRWYDKDPHLMKAIECLRASSPKVQRKAALKILLALESNNDFDNLEL